MKKLARLILDANVRYHERCKHVRNGEYVSNQIATIELIQIEGDDGYYLFYFDDAGHELNDLSFDTLHDALRQIEFEFDEKTRTEIQNQLINLK